MTGFDLEGYMTVTERIRLAREQWPDMSLQSDWKLFETPDGLLWIVVKAYLHRTPDDPCPAVGHAWELYPGKTPYSRGSELMVGETSAWGRAIAAAGLNVEKVATREEVRAAQTRQTNTSAPSNTAEAPATQAQMNALTKKAEALGVEPALHEKLWNALLERDIKPLSKRDASKLMDLERNLWEVVAGSIHE